MPSMNDGSYLAYNNDTEKRAGGQRQSRRLVDVVRVRREHNYRLIIVNRVVREKTVLP